ncbi:molybdenum cofactor biosynthesis protein F [Aspergillus karnatakaensis]|uniref:molybdenum cofactor biosynthesis F family protein n=1 Tax=Aspergillus karnatakaensis TaxID=1810916 RepID=UPI003CCCFC70
MSNETPGYIPVSEWPDLEALAVGYGEHLMSESNKLNGKRLVLTFNDGTRIAHQFSDDNTLKWEILESAQSGKAEYKALEVRPAIFFIDFYKPDHEEQVTLILNTSTGQAIAGISGFHTKDNQKRTRTKFSHASIDGDSDSSNTIAPFQPTQDLIGKHILYRYTPRDAYEHIYHNQGTFTWHCLSGTEKGLADTEPCKMLKVAKKLYLLFWSEKIMPVESIVMVDLERMRSTGRFFCWDPKPKRRVQMLFGSYATVLAETDAAGVVASKM